MTDRDHFRHQSGIASIRLAIPAQKTRLFAVDEAGHGAWLDSLRSRLVD